MYSSENACNLKIEQRRPLRQPTANDESINSVLHK